LPAGDTIGLPWSSHNSFSSLPTISNGAAWTELKLAIARNVAPLNDESNACFGCMCFPPSCQPTFPPDPQHMIIGLSARVGNPGFDAISFAAQGFRKRDLRSVRLCQIAAVQ
jgi:hypothetical protein